MNKPQWMIFSLVVTCTLPAAALNRRFRTLEIPVPGRTERSLPPATQPLKAQDSDQDAQDAAQEARDREQEARDQEQERQEAERDRQEEVRDREQERAEQQQEIYEHGTEALDEHQWQRAISYFDQASHGPRGDGALYWKAYALNKQGDRSAALTTLAQFHRSFPNSRWTNDARALELEIRQDSGQRVNAAAAGADEDLQLIAINGLMGSDPQRAVPLLRKFLEGSHSLKLKKRALFVLSQSGTPEARTALGDIARGNSNPDLQRSAIEYLGLMGGDAAHQQLSQIYASTNDVDIKRHILRSFMVAGERDRLLQAAKTETNPELRREAIQQLGVMGSRSELWQLYQREPSVELRRSIIRALFVGGGSSQLEQLANNEKSVELRREAIRDLGLMGADRTGGILTSLYAKESDAGIRRQIIDSLFTQGNAHAMIEIARREKDPTLRREAVSKLALMHSKEATDYMLEILNH